MPPSRSSVYLELFEDSEMVHLMAALLAEGVYEEIRGPAVRPTAESDSQMKAFGDGTLAGGQLHWAIRDSGTDTCLGSLQATSAPEKSIFVGYRVRSENRNNGIATSALCLLVSELASKFPQRPIVADVRQDNAASCQVLVKCGFAQLRPPSADATMRREIRFLWSKGGAA